MNVALLIALEDTGDKRVPPVKYAEADVRAFGRAIHEVGFHEADQVLLVNAEATKSILESKIRRTVRSLTENDTFFLYWVGHGFSENGRNYLACHDTQLSDLVATSVSLKFLFEELRRSSRPPFVMFLDCRQSGLLAALENRRTHGPWIEDEVREFFDSRQRCVCFVSRGAGEESWPSSQVQHGAWAYNVIEAFRGNAPTALEEGSLLTCASLQNYLRQAVPRTLRREYADKKEQTPWIRGAATSEFLLADLTDLLAGRKAPFNPSVGQVANVSLVGRRHDRVRSLSGFKKKTHRVPDEVNDRAESFVAKLAAAEIERDLDAIYAALRAEFRFKRADLDASGAQDGAGAIISPYFNYSISVCLNPHQPSEVIWRRQVARIKEPQRLFAEEFANVFGEMFDTVEFTPARSVDLEALIDRIEELDDERIALDYGMDATWLKLRIKGTRGQIEITPENVSIVHPKPASAKLLLQSFFDLREALVGEFGLGVIPFRDSAAGL